MQLRVARHTERVDELVRFYRDGIGLEEVGGFRGHAGYDGVFLALPGSGAHLEFTTGGGQPAPEPHPESLLVLYLGSADAVQAVASRLEAEPVAAANPYWAEHGLTFEDPDGFRVVLVPERWPESDPAPVTIREHTGSRAELRPLFELAEDSARALDGYIDEGRVLIALAGEQTVGHLQISDTDDPSVVEIKNMAVDEAHRGLGVGRALVAAAIALAREEGRSSLTVATAAADVGNLRFYQRLGFRMRSVERDAFTPATGYGEGRQVDGIELRDRVWLDRSVADARVGFAASPGRRWMQGESAAGSRLTDAEQAIAQQLIGELDRFNIETTGIRDAREMLAAETGENGELLGGAYGWTWGGTCWIEALWVSESMRRRGLGSRLMRAAEQIARDRGCGQLALDTHTFQAPDFYARHGFEVVGRLTDYPAGHDELLMRKRLEPVEGTAS